jgi:hypothetical protein
MTTPWNLAGTTTAPEAPAPQQAWQTFDSRPSGAPAAEAHPFGPQHSGPQHSGPQQFEPQQFGPQPGPQPFGSQPGGQQFGGQQAGGQQFGPQPFGPQQFGPQPFGGQPGGMPPQGPGSGGPGFPGGPAPKKNTTLLISLVVAAVLLIGGGVTAFLLLSGKDTTQTAGPVLTTSTGPTMDPTKATPTQAPATSGDATPTKTTSTTATPTTTTTTSTEDEPVVNTDIGGGDMATAEALVENWLGFVNEADAETASHLICAAEQQDFIDGFDGVTSPANQLEVVDMQWDGENIALTLGAVGDTTGQSTLELTMWPTDTGYFLICSNPLSEADLNW